MKKVVMLCPSMSQPRYHKRARLLAENYSVSVIAFRRKYYNESKFNDGVPVDVVGELPDGAHFKRLFFLLSVYRRLSLAKESIDVFYAFSVDLYLVAVLAGLRVGVYEVGDIRSAGFKGFMFRVFEKFIIRHARKVIITSAYFYSEYYSKMGLPKNNFQVVENKLPDVFFDNKRKPIFFDNGGDNCPPVRRKIRIGVVGFFRYKVPIKLLLDFCNLYPGDYEVHFFGDGPLVEQVKAEQSDNVFYHGAFSNPKDLPKIYSLIDVNFVVYDSSDLNVRLALPNKFYESIYFCVPIIVASNTALESEVVKKGVGFSISLDEIEFRKEMRSLTFSVLNFFKNSCLQIDPKSVVESKNVVLIVNSDKETLNKSRNQR